MSFTKRKENADFSANNQFFLDGACQGGTDLLASSKVAAGGTAFSALVADRTSEQERPKVLSVVWAMRLLGVLLGTVLVNQVFGSACEAGASRASVWATQTSSSAPERRFG